MTAKTLIAVVGPTAVGKTKLAITLAKHFGTEIVSADSRQFFKEMEIGTAVPSQSELQTVRHHFVQHKSIFEPYSVGDFEKEAISLLDELFKKNNFVVLAGGSGLYIDAVVRGLHEFPKINPTIRKVLNGRLMGEGIQSLQRELKQRDPQYFEMVDIMNPHRLIRALEVCISSNRPFSSFLDKNKVKRPFRTIFIGLNAERELIYSKINERVDAMMNRGLLEEAGQLYGHKDLNALQTIGYRELFGYFKGSHTLDFAISEIKKNTRRFARRQLIWLRKNKNILWADYLLNHQQILKKLTKRIESGDAST